MTVKRRIALLVAGAGFIASLLFSVAVFFELVEQPFDLLDMELADEAREIAHLVAAHAGSAESILNQLDDETIGDFWIKVFDQDSGALLYQTPLASSLDLAPIQPGESKTIRVPMPDREAGGKTTLRQKAFLIEAKGRGFVVRIACSMNKLWEEIWELVYSLVAGLILSGLALVVISYYIAGKILQPIGKMRDMAKEISDRNLDKRLPAGPENDEFNELARTINRMLDRLQHSFENQRNFLFDTSHELKTPLTTMRLAIDELCASDIEKMPDATRENLLRVNEQVRRMDRLVKDLLNLSALEMSDAIEQTPLSVTEIVTALLGEYRFLAEARGIRIENRLPVLDKVGGDREKLTRAFSNILDNAVKYNIQGGSIIVEGEQADGWVTISVANTGPAVSEEDVGKVFDQFYRVEKSRSLQYGGSGLGLAIVKRIVILHGGDVRMESRQGELNRLRVTLPSAPA